MQKWGLDKMKVKTMLMIAAMLLAIVPMIAFGIMANAMISSDGTDMFEDELNNMAIAQASALDATLARVKADAASVAALPGISEYGSTGNFSSVGKSTATDEVKRFMGDNPVIDSITLVDKSGTIVINKKSDSNVSATGAFEGFSEYANYKDDALYFDGVTKSKTMIIKKTLSNATLFISYSLDIVGKFTTNASFYDQGTVTIIDPNKLWTTDSKSVNDNFENRFTTEVANRLEYVQDNSPSLIFNYIGNGKTAGVLIRAGGENGLTALVSCPVAREYFYSGNALLTIFAIAGVLMVISVVFAVIVPKTVTKPLKNFSEVLDKIRRGDHEARISTVANNEYGQMSRAFNNVIDEIVVSEDRYKVISDMSDNIIFEWNFKTNEVMFSNNYAKKFSYRPPSDHFGDSFLMKAKLHPEDADRYRLDLDQLEKGKNFENNEYRMKNTYGDFVWILMRTATLKDAEGKPTKAVGVMVDIDRAKKSEAKLTEQASFDALTELYNRETIESHIDNEISLSEMRKSEMAVLFIDVDDFKHYNDNYSHATGDLVLKFLAKTIKETIDGIGFAGRYGGDEFIAMIRNAEVNSPAEAAQRLIDKLAAGFDAGADGHLTVSVSIGIAVIKDNYNTRVEYLIGKADDAMYSVKKSGKSNYAFI